MAGARGEMINGGNYSPRIAGRPIPRRGQVKIAILMGIAHSFASIFSASSRRQSASHLS
ncbi:hypothetical protein ERO13_A05G164200v2 [Gossypium hirsutum]|uniref:Uncharacterized protein n=11 Tax=Gossypium TaxID=3633 RepID=A0A5J5VQ30_GOSBA|nr:hypothetical protein ES319_A05G172400v1 [Gossypium barbadense]KAG4199711.1 hypothetical protein ERO13_A05G164200v2 [Gossypium hirsutum]KAK5831417.1 hypothetical protein PVK06_015215 [Gossypium arboreum]KJB53424.1 hypothetical protein B456_009G172100 [Gossypium raimondii]MBA0807849.1 hypothetical protein [Gossypium harknessii]TYH17228.1 hypothetical protein ES288_A05G176000v1 [Gossypium darwinii]TYI27452.1 hypothetical protein ES332_A05G178500v1 [Gossypium tomentosum]TYJ34542.1 hypothetica